MIAIIPARSESKGLPNKNIKQLGQHPLIAYSINAALNSCCFTDVFVTTDSDEIAQISLDYGAQVIERPSFLAQNDTSMADVINHVYNYLSKREKIFPEGIFCLLQPTSPLRGASHIIACTTAFRKSSFKSAVSLSEDIHSPFKSLCIKQGELTPLFNVKYLHANRQTLEKTYRQNGAIYLTYWRNFLSDGGFIHFPAMPYIMEEKESIDIDTLEDFQCVERGLVGCN